MDPKELRGLMEAYMQVYAPQEVDEAVKGESSERRKDLAAERRSGIKPLSAKEGERYASHKMSQMAYAKRKRMGEEVEQIDEISAELVLAASKKADIQRGKAAAAGDKEKAVEKMKQSSRLYAKQKKIRLNKEELDIFDAVLEFLQVEGYAETLEEAEWLMANVIDEEAIDIILGEAEGSYGQTPKSDAAYIALATGKGKSKTKSLAFKHAIRSAADRYNSDKPYSHRSKMTQSDRDYHRGQSENSGKDREGIDFDEFDTGASGPGGKPKGKKLERQRKTGVSEAQVANRDPDKYEAGEKKKYAPVRGERTPMPPRGDKRREDFEKWYAANVR